MCKKTLISLLIGVFVLSACGQNDNLLTETSDNYVNEKIDTNFAETENKTVEDENNEPSEDLPKPLEVPVNTNAEDIHYYCRDGIKPEYAEHRCVSDGENIYLAYGRPDLYVMPIGADEHSPANIDNPEGLIVYNIAIDTYGRIHLLMTDCNYDEWFIWRLDEDYQIDKVIDISAYFETIQRPLWFLIDKDGTYYLQELLERNGIIVDSEGVLKHKFTLESLGIRWIYEAAVGKDGRIYLVYGNNEDKKREIGELDVENCSIKKENSPLYFPDGETFSAMSGGTDTNLLLYSPFSGIWAYDREKGVLENRVPISDIGSGSGMDLYPLTFLPDGRLFLWDATANDRHADDVDMLLKYIPAGR